MRPRRSILASLGLVALAGCMGPTAEQNGDGDAGARAGDPAGNASADQTTEAGNGTDAAAENPSDGDTDADGDETQDPALESRGPVRAENDVVPSVRTEEDDENVELTGNGSVRFVAAWRGTTPTDGGDSDGPPEREPVYETTPWEDWVELRTVPAAHRKAAAYAADELGVDGLSGATSSAIDGGEGLDAVVSTTTTLNRDGEVVSEPEVAFEDLVAATPRAVEVTYVLADREYETTVPIYVRHSVAQYD